MVVLSTTTNLFSGHYSRTILYKQCISAVADEPTRCAASRQMCCKQRWTLSVINLQPN